MIGPLSEEFSWLESGGEELFAVLTEPPSPNGWGVIQLQGLPRVPSSHRNRMAVRLAAQFAAGGFHSVRLDWPGVGESTGRAPRDREIPFDTHAQHVVAASRWLAEHDVTRTVVVGSCFGATTGLASTDDLDHRGLVLVSPFIATVDRPSGLPYDQPRDLSAREYLRIVIRPSVIRSLKTKRQRQRHLDLARHQLASLRARVCASPGARGERAWIDQRTVDRMARALDMGTPIHLVFGAGDSALTDFNEARRGRLGRVLRAHSDQVSVTVVPGSGYIYNSVSRQHAIEQLITQWVVSLRPSDA